MSQLSPLMSFSGSGLSGPVPQISGDQQNGPYLVYDLHSEYVWDNETLKLPVAYNLNDPTGSQAVPDPASTDFADRQKSFVMQTGEPTGQKIVTFRIVRLGLPVVAPDPSPSNDNEVLASAVVRPQAPFPDADGVTPIYAMVGRYVYDLIRPVYASTDYLDAGATPVDPGTPLDNQIDPAQFQEGIAEGDIGPASTSSTPPVPPLDGFIASGQIPTNLPPPE